jgi:hypothetical protein
LARYGRCDRGTLYNQWPEMLHCAPSTLTLADCLDAVLLIRAAAKKRTTIGWRHMSHEWLRVRPERLHRIARRFDLSLSQVDDAEFVRLIGTFEERVIGMLRLAPSRSFTPPRVPIVIRSTPGGSHRQIGAGA